MVNDFLVTIFFGIALELCLASGGAKKHCLSFDVGLVLRCLFINHHSTYRVFEHVSSLTYHMHKEKGFKLSPLDPVQLSEVPILISDMAKLQSQNYRTSIDAYN